MRLKVEEVQREMNCESKSNPPSLLPNWSIS